MTTERPSTSTGIDWMALVPLTSQIDSATEDSAYTLEDELRARLQIESGFENVEMQQKVKHPLLKSMECPIFIKAIAREGKTFPDIINILKLPVLTELWDKLSVDHFVNAEGQDLIKASSIDIRDLSSSINKAYLLKWLLFMPMDTCHCITNTSVLIHQLLSKGYFQAALETLNDPEIKFAKDWLEYCLRLVASVDLTALNEGQDAQRCIDIVDRLLALGAGINEEDKACKVAPLHIAAGAGSLRMVTHLVECGAELNPKPEFDRERPLYFAVLKGHDDIVKYLIDVGAELNPEYLIPAKEVCVLQNLSQQQEQQATRLKHYKSLSSSDEVEVAEDFSFPAKMQEAQYRNRSSLLRIAIRFSHFKIARLLLEKGFDFNKELDEKVYSLSNSTLKLIENAVNSVGNEQKEDARVVQQLLRGEKISSTETIDFNEVGNLTSLANSSAYIVAAGDDPTKVNFIQSLYNILKRMILTSVTHAGDFIWQVGHFLANAFDFLWWNRLAAVIYSS